MVNEVETLLASFFENGHVNDEWRKEEPKVNAYIARLKRFIDKYKENSDKFSKDKWESVITFARNRRNIFAKSGQKQLDFSSFERK
ncbi:hypothetical protein L3K57_15795 (plasmid) [Enterococcus faecium]|uniref:hypothetical protein n=1 Tax=Enterococcus faecium TaxID=1352 RepID=UPI001F311664|nr:hypothetical protein [Enterococcus faecium]UJV65267.1 hypothetical protein L3K57_15795 [Enterococcus faecium]